MARPTPYDPEPKADLPGQAEAEELRRRVEQLSADNAALRSDLRRAQQYIRTRTDNLLAAAGTVPLRPEELDDATLLEMDPIGIVTEMFSQILEHSNETNEALRIAHTEIEAVFDSVGASVMVVDPEHRIRAYNREAQDKLLGGHPAAEGLTCFRAVCNKQTPGPRCALAGALQEDGRHRCGDWVNRGRHYDVVATPLRDREGKIEQVVLVYMDISERLQSQQDLKASEHRYRDLVENAHDLIQSVRPDGQFLFVNQAWRQRLGYEDPDLEGLNLFDVVHPDHHSLCRELLTRLARESGAANVEVHYRAKNGDRVILEGNFTAVTEDGTVTATRAIFRDVTELRRAREESARVERLESVGVLAGGIAHDFNNLLTSMLHNLTLARVDLPHGDYPRMEDAESAILRAQGLTQQLLTFSRGGAPVREALELPTLLDDVVPFAMAGSPVKHHINCPRDLPAVHADPGQLSQVIQNLAINAVQMMPEGGNLWVRARRVSRPSMQANISSRGPWVELTIADDGPGIDRERLERIFDPYFSTREGGTGLGLATVHSIIQRHEGHIAVASVPGAGTEFRMCLPALEAPEQTSRSKTEPAEVSGRILVMDDDQMIRDTAAELLELAGFQVDTVADGAEAVECYRSAAASSTPFDAVIMDLTIPGGMGGAEAVQHLRELDPEVVAVVSSGYNTDPVMANFREYGFAAVAPKPYRIASLVELLGSLLGDRPN